VPEAGSKIKKKNKNMKNKAARLFPFAAIVLTLVLLVFIAAAGAARAAIVTVTNANDSGAGSLRQAIIGAASGDTIVFDANAFAGAQTISLTSGELSIGKNLTIVGTGARRLTVRRAAAGAANFRVFNVVSGVVGISGMTIANGNDSGGGGALLNLNGTVTLSGVSVAGNTGGSGAVRNSSGVLTILNSTVAGNLNLAGAGGVLVGGGTVSIANSTVSGNSATGAGGIGVSNGGALNMNNVTVTNNSITASNPNAAGGVNVVAGGSINLRNTIISGNAATGSASPDARGVFASNGNNLVGNAAGSAGFSVALNDKLNVSANLGALGDNGGQTDTHRAGAGSPAIDAGNACVIAGVCPANNPPVALPNDQRGAGFARQQGAGVDIGAIESSGATAAGVSISGRVVTPAGDGVRGARVTLTDGAGNARTALTSSFGFYSFSDVTAGQVVVVSVSAKRYSFVAQVLNVSEAVENLNFTAQEF
jgi:hypothetical protein